MGGGMFRYIHRWRCHQGGTRASLYLTAIAVLSAEGCGPFPFREAATGTQPATLHSTTTDGDTTTTCTVYVSEDIDIGTIGTVEDCTTQ